MTMHARNPGKPSGRTTVQMTVETTPRVLVMGAGLLPISTPAHALHAEGRGHLQGGTHDAAWCERRQQARSAVRAHQGQLRRSRRLSERSRRASGAYGEQDAARARRDQRAEEAQEVLTLRV